MTKQKTDISFRVNCIPVAQPRQRHGIVNGHVRNYLPSNNPVHAFKAAVKVAAYDEYKGTPLNEPLQIKIIAVFPRPASMIWKTKDMVRIYKTSKPDFDNLAKSVCDALNGLLWRDDSLICSATIEKWIAAGNEQPHVFVIVKSPD